jgi:hypothetical protein
MSPEQLWAMRTVWNTICAFNDETRNFKFGFGIVSGELVGQTVNVGCNGIVWMLRSENPRAFLPDQGAGRHGRPCRTMRR